MKKQVWIIMGVLLVMGLACGFPTSTPTSELPADTPAEPLPSDSPTETELPTVEPTPALPPRPIVYFPYGDNPALVTVVDPVTGALLYTFNAPGIGWVQEFGAGGDAIFYVNEGMTSLFRVAFDGSLMDLAFAHPGGGLFDAVILPSPDGQKIAWGSAMNMDASGVDVILKVANIDGTGIQTLIDTHLAESRRPSPFKWSNDGNYLYYSNIPYGIGGYILFYGGPDLIRINLTTLAEETILPDGHCLCAMALSPDESKVARITRDAGSALLTVHDILNNTDETFSFPPKYLQAGGIVWAPDGNSLMLTLAIGDMDHEAFSVVKVDLVSLTTSYFLTDDARCVRTREWSAADVVWLSDNDYNVYRMDANTGVLTFHASDGWIITNSK
ncbi:MAG: hypothetical protein ABIG43_03380 [Chloroflexota bacterium]